MDCRVMPVFPSPVPARPTTTPYPTSWLLLTPARDVRSLIRSEKAADAQKGEMPSSRDRSIDSFFISIP